MAAKIDISDLLDEPPAGRDRVGHSNPTSDARRLEASRRSNQVTNLARAALTRLHSDDYRELLRQAKAKLDAERGPLPD